MAAVTLSAIVAEIAALGDAAVAVVVVGRLAAEAALATTRSVPTARPGALAFAPIVALLAAMGVELILVAARAALVVVAALLAATDGTAIAAARRLILLPVRVILRVAA